MNVLLTWGCSLSLELSRAKFISPDAGLFDDLDAEGLNFRGDMVFLNRLRNGFVIGVSSKL